VTAEIRFLRAVADYKNDDDVTEEQGKTEYKYISN
jgi:hypothetical protein